VNPLGSGNLLNVQAPSTKVAATGSVEFEPTEPTATHAPAAQHVTSARLLLAEPGVSHGRFATTGPAAAGAATLGTGSAVAADCEIPATVATRSAPASSERKARDRGRAGTTERAVDMVPSDLVHTRPNS